MQCDQARSAWLGARYGDAPAADLAQHLAGCEACRAFVATQQQLDRALASLPARGPSSSFDARFFARLDMQRQPRHWARWAWLSVPLAAAAALMLFLHAQTPPAATRLAPAATPSTDLGLTRELELVQALDVVSRLDEIESYDVLSQLDDADLRQGSGVGR